MAIGKKTRFDVFKRDGFQCQYCSAKPPSAVLEVDHIIPRAKGGGDQIENLLTACFDCNRGKRDGLLTSVPESLDERYERVREREEQYRAFTRYQALIRRRENRDVEAVAKVFADSFPGYELSESFRQSIRRQFLQRIDVNSLCEFMHIAISRFPRSRDRATKYFCGIAWRTIKGGR